VSFEAVLSSLRREYGADREADGKPLTRAFFLEDGKLACGFAAAAELAFEDFVQESARPEPPRPLPSDAPDVIASELALSGTADLAGLQSLRRRFMWMNHPDRRPDLPRELANRRVAIANMLIDRALRANRSAGR
jgi:hypothetical protein